MHHLKKIILLSIICSYALSITEKPYLLFTHNNTNRPQGDIFFTLFAVLHALEQYDNQQINGLNIDFGDKGINYTSKLGANWWTYYFKNNQWAIPEDCMTSIPEYKTNIMFFHARFDTPIPTLHKLWNKYVGIHDHIIQIANQFKQKHFSYHPIIGIYCQAHDHISYKKLKKILNVQTKKLKKCYIFLVTDDNALTQKLKTTFKEQLICSPYVLNKYQHESYAETSKRHLINCLLLSKCNLLIKTSCSLSACASVFNPHMPVIALNQEWFELE